MATIPAPQTWVDTTSGGQTVVGAGALNREVRDAYNFMLNPPRAWFYLTGNESIADSSLTQLGTLLAAEFEDSDNMINTSYPYQVTIQTAGRYRVNWSVRVASNSTGRRTGYLYKNGAELKKVSVNAAVNSQQTTVADVTYGSFVVGDVLSLYLFQNSGGALAVNGGVAGAATPGEYLTFLQCRFLGS